MIAWWNKKSKIPGLIGLTWNTEGIGLAHVLSGAGPVDKPEVRMCEFYEERDPLHQEKILHDLINQYQLKGGRCSWVLDPADYRLLSLNAPEVTREELREVAKWKVKDLIERPLNEVVIDAFPIPVNDPEQKKMMYVVVANVDYVRNKVEKIRKSGLSPEIVDITELALRNLAVRLRDGHSSIALFELHQGESLFIICKQNDLQLARRCESDMSMLVGHHTPDSETPKSDRSEQELLYDYLVEDISRSYSFYESQFNEEIPKQLLFVNSTAMKTDHLFELLENNLEIKIINLDLKEVCLNNDILNRRVDYHCIPMVGCAMKI